MQINKINNKNRYYYEIINIYYNWWGKDIKKKTLNEIDDSYKDTLSQDFLPNIYALIINDTLIGTYEINKNDDIEKEKYTPYLANIYIKERYRGYGYSKILVSDAIEKIKKMGYDRLYLHSHHQNYYEKFGFKLKKEVETKYGLKRIYELKIK